MTDLNKELVDILHTIDINLQKLSDKLNGYRDVPAGEVEYFEDLYKQSWHNLGREGWGISKTFNDAQRNQHIEYATHLKYYTLLQESAFYWQIINKPFGYAGDAQMMRIIYKNDFDGKSVFGKVVNKFTTDERACRAVRNRKSFLIDEIRKVGEGRILSLAAGPAEEIIAVLNQEQDNHYEFLALDHDINTARPIILSNQDCRLQYCIANAFRLIKGDCQYAVPRRTFIHTCTPQSDFKGWRKFISPLKYDFNSLEKESFDMVYSAGLYDYIETFEEHHKGTKALTQTLFSLVKPGGSLIVGNFSPENPDHIRFSMEYFQNWHLIYRDENAMMEFLHAIDDKEIKSAEIVMEPERINYFLKVIKRC